jgi:hypothetical protein
MTIENLLKVLPPPAEPFHVFEGPWEVIETQLRTRLPQDYKDLMRLYGAGLFAGFFAIYLPAGPTIGSCIVPTALGLQRSLIDDPSVPIYPRPGGLLVCGLTHNGEYICWLTRGSTPDEWPIVVWDVRPRCEEEEYTTFECDLTDFIAGIISRGNVFPGYEGEDDDGWSAARQPFTPIQEIKDF